MTDPLTRAKTFLDSGLRNQSLWGKAGQSEGQRAQGFARRYGEHIDGFENSFTSEIGGARKADPAKSRALFETGEGADALSATMDSARATADVASQFGKHDAARSITRALGTLERTQRQAAAVRAARGDVPRETDDPAGAALEWLSRSSAGDPGGPLGLSSDSQQRQLEDATLGSDNATAEAAANRLAARGATFRAAASMAKIAKNGSRLGVNALLSPRDEEDDEVRVTPPRAAPTLTPETFDAHRDHLDRMAKDPSYFGDVMGASFGNMAQTAPEVFNALSVQAAKTVQYLSAVAPGGSSGGPFAQRYPVGADELWEYNERLRAVADPEYIRDELSAGRLSAPAAETYEVMYPKAFQQLQLDTFDRLQQLQQAGIPVPLQAREQLDTMLNLDGGGDPALTWKVAERAYAATARKNNSSSGQVQAGNGHESAMTSGALSTLGNGASAVAQTG